MGTCDVAATATGPGGIAARRPHAVAAGTALALLACVVIGSWAWSALRDKHTDGHWELRSGTHGVPAGLLIDIDNEEVTGQGPCNRFRAEWSQDDGAGVLTSTAIGCSDPVGRQEETFYHLLSADTVEVEGDELRLTSGDQTLVFSRVT